MANKKSRSQKSNTRSFSWFSRFGARNAAIVAVFVLAFAGLGGYYIHKSYAASCIYTTVRQGNTGYCVTELQSALVVMNNYYHGRLISPSVDGIFGPQTYNAVWSYQKYALGQANPGGLVISLSSGGQTWYPMCRDLNGAFAYYRYAGLTTWRNRASSAFTGLGCSNVISL